MRYKSWPYLDDWNEIFGKDLIDASNGPINEDRSGAKVGNAEGQTLDEACEMDVNSQAPNVEKANESRSSGKKRAADHNDNLCELNESGSSGNKRAAVDGNDKDNLCEILGQFRRSLEQQMERMVGGIGYEADLGKARKEVFNMLGGIPNMSMDEKLDISHMFAKNTDCLEMFMGLPEHARARYVRRLLAGD